MITTIIISILAAWTVFGFFVLFALSSTDKSPDELNAKHLILFGPVLTAGCLILAIFSLLLDALVAWANKE